MVDDSFRCRGMCAGNSSLQPPVPTIQTGPSTAHMETFAGMMFNGMREMQQQQTKMFELMCSGQTTGCQRPRGLAAFLDSESPRFGMTRRTSALLDGSAPPLDAGHLESRVADRAPLERPEPSKAPVLDAATPGAKAPVTAKAGSVDDDDDDVPLAEMVPKGKVVSVRAKEEVVAPHVVTLLDRLEERDRERAEQKKLESAAAKAAAKAAKAAEKAAEPAVGVVKRRRLFGKTEARLSTY
jgi:hypothetical protein